MLDGLLIGLVVLGALSCPLMMLLARRGIGPGCALMGWRPRGKGMTLESLRARERELAARVAQLEAVDRERRVVAADRA